ncbi:adenosylcobinamide-GDP ribazoletransferase [Niallia circulans]
MTNEKMVYWFFSKYTVLYGNTSEKGAADGRGVSAEKYKNIPFARPFPRLYLYGDFLLLNEYTPFTALAVAFIVWISTILLTGGLHLDGWMDASDAYFSYQDAKKD